MIRQWSWHGLGSGGIENNARRDNRLRNDGLVGCIIAFCIVISIWICIPICISICISICDCICALTRVYAAFGRWTLAVTLGAKAVRYRLKCSFILKVWLTLEQTADFRFRCLDLFLYLHVYENNAKRDNRLRNDGLFGCMPVCLAYPRQSCPDH